MAGTATSVSVLDVDSFRFPLLAISGPGDHFLAIHSLAGCFIGEY
jgi:hypothetical protein